MRDDLTPGSTANLIRMTRTLHKGAFLVVEGDAEGGERALNMVARGLDTA